MLINMHINQIVHNLFIIRGKLVHITEFQGLTVFVDWNQNQLYTHEWTFLHTHPVCLKGRTVNKTCILFIDFLKYSMYVYHRTPAIILRKKRATLPLVLLLLDSTGLKWMVGIGQTNCIGLASTRQLAFLSQPAPSRKSPLIHTPSWVRERS